MTEQPPAGVPGTAQPQVQPPDAGEAPPLGCSRRSAIIAGALAASFVALLVAKAVIFPTPSGDPIDLSVPEGASVGRVAATLAQRGIVPNALVLKLWVAATGSTAHLQPGEYRFRRGTPYRVVVADLRKGTNIPMVKIVVPEGFNIRQIGRRLQDKAGLDSAKFVSMAFSGAKRYSFPYLKDVKTKSLEGYLFPKTYMVREDMDEAGVLKWMVEQYGKDTAGLPWSRAKKLGLNPDQILAVASMIEKETSRPEERKRIAGVIYNRLTDGIPVGFGSKRLRRLQVDATVLYALGRDSGQLRIDDYRSTASRYNTYVYEGLPPGPICNPGVASIYAALVPEDHDYFFYVAKGDGTHAFATTFEEFKVIKRQLGYGR